jgi:pyruvate dehydrogenase (quinone)
MNVCEAIVDLLARNSVKRIYGVGGDALNPFTDAVRRDGRVRWIGVKHEGDGALAAYAESAVADGLGACAATLGPGPLHLLNGLYEAKREGGAVVAITGALPFSERGDEAAGFALSKVREGLLGLEGDHAQFENWAEEFQANL